MKVVINGKEKQIDEKLTILNLLNEFNLKPKVTVVEINKEIINRSNFSQIKIKKNDRIELIRFMGGG